MTIKNEELDRLEALCSAAKNLLEECYQADAREELPSNITGELMDAVRDGLIGTSEALPALIARVRALQAALDERIAERQQYREKLAALLGIDPEKDSVLEEVSKLAVRVRELEARVKQQDEDNLKTIENMQKIAGGLVDGFEQERDAFARRCLDKFVEIVAGPYLPEKSYKDFDAILAAVKRELAQENADVK